MAHTVWNLGSLTGSARVQPRQFVAGIEPGQGVVIGRSREPKPMILLRDAWIEVNDVRGGSALDAHGGKYSLALGKDPLTAALLLPVGQWLEIVTDAGVGATDQPRTGISPHVEQLFRAQGTLWATKFIAIDFQEQGSVAESDVDVHLDWSVTNVDWWSWFIGWNRLEAPPDGSLVDGDRGYA